jgi:hypothetical protein
MKAQRVPCSGLRIPPAEPATAAARHEPVYHLDGRARRTRHQREDVTPVWLRTREIKPGVHETQSAGHNAARQVGIAFGVLVGAVLLFSLIASPGTNLPIILLLVIVGGPIAFWHYRHHKTHRAEYRDRRPGPWDG